MSGFTTTNDVTPDDLWDYFILSPNNHNHGFSIIQELPHVVSLRPVSDYSRAAPLPQPRSSGSAGSRTSPLPFENLIQNPWTRHPVSLPRSFPGGGQTLPRDDSKLTIDEQSSALKKLKKEIYNPAPKRKRFFHRVSAYYREREKNGFVEKGKLKHCDDDEDDDRKRCAICLEDFEPSEEVVITPCNHMFHEGCVVPWIRIHGQCPVCRFAICERMKQSQPVNNHNNIPNLSSNELLLLLERLLQ